MTASRAADRDFHGPGVSARVRPGGHQPQPPASRSAVEEPGRRWSEPGNGLVVGDLRSAIPVVPAIDITTGVVTLSLGDGRVRRWHPAPRTLWELLARAVAPARWDPATELLWVCVAAAGYRGGKAVSVSLPAAPDAVGGMDPGSAPPDPDPRRT